MIPMGLGFLAASLKNQGVDYHISDNYLKSFHRRSWDESGYRHTVREYRPTHVCVSSMSVEWREAKRLIEITREEAPASKIICGGPHATFAAKDIALLCDFVVIGEGESALPDLLADSVPPQFREGNILSYPFIRSLDSLVNSTLGRKEMIPWADFSPLHYDLVMPWWGLDRKPVVNLNTSRGCPFACKFCSVLGPWGRGYRYFTAPIIVDEIAHLKTKYGVRGVCFREDNFIVRRERVQDICRLLIERDLSIDWAAEARVDSIDEPLADLMSRSGCKGILFGVESGSERMLKAMKKGITANDTRRAFQICKKYGIRTYTSIVYGLPGELPEDRALTKEFLAEIEPGFLEESIYLGIPGSAYYSELWESKNYEYFDPVTLHIYPHGFKELHEQITGQSSQVLPY